jgi:multiple sugar transport system permease protein
MILVVGLALLVHSAPRRSSAFFRFVYYLPGALAGSASVVIWLFMLDPEVSPVAAIYHAVGWTNFNDVASPGHLPVIFTLMAFWTGAGGWILILYGALNNIPHELIEAARLDGAGAWQAARRIKLPLIKKWIGYMAILSLAAGSQLFVEPSIVSAAGSGFISPSWAPNELAYNYAFGQADFNGASAISIDLLLFALVCAAVIVSRSGLFRRD